MFTNLETNRLVLRCIDHGDRGFILEEFQNDFINRYLYDEEPMTDISQADELIDFYTMAELRKQNRWVLIDKTTNTKLGTCGFHLWDPDNKEVEIGFELLEQYNGRGYMLEALKALIEFAGSEMKVEKISAVVYVHNKKCIQLLERLGFTKAGEEETEFRGQIYLHSIYKWRKPIMDFVLHGHCGVYCGACPILVATKAGKIEEDKQCYGCKSEKPTGYCATCGIKACAQQKGYGFCNQCNKLKTCELIQKFVLDTQYPYGQCVLKNMETIRDEGLPKWLERQDKRWRCKNCGATHSWYHETCPQCGQAVASYKADL